jgi:hypothetical protein
MKLNAYLRWDGSTDRTQVGSLDPTEASSFVNKWVNEEIGLGTPYGTVEEGQIWYQMFDDPQAGQAGIEFVYKVSV